MYNYVLHISVYISDLSILKCCKICKNLWSHRKTGKTIEEYWNLIYSDLTSKQIWSETNAWIFLAARPGAAQWLRLAPILGGSSGTTSVRALRIGLNGKGRGNKKLKNELKSQSQNRCNDDAKLVQSLENWKWRASILSLCFEAWTLQWSSMTKLWPLYTVAVNDILTCTESLASKYHICYIMPCNCVSL